jgi:hypothetical protein
MLFSSVHPHLSPSQRVPHLTTRIIASLRRCIFSNRYTHCYRDMTLGYCYHELELEYFWPEGLVILAQLKTLGLDD